MAADLRLRLKGSEKSLVSWLVLTVKQRCDTKLQPALLDLRVQRYGNKTYPDVKRMSEAILETCPPGATPPPDLETAILYASDTIRLRKEYTALEKLKSDKGHDDWLNLLLRVREVLKTIKANASVQPPPHCDSSLSSTASDCAQSKSDKQIQAKNPESEKSVEDPETQPETRETMEAATPRNVEADFSQPDDPELVKLEDIKLTKNTLLSLLVAFEKIEQYVLTVWSDFRDGSIPLATAADITFAAIGMIHQRAHKSKENLDDQCAIDLLASMESSPQVLFVDTVTLEPAYTSAHLVCSEARELLLDTAQRRNSNDTASIGSPMWRRLMLMVDLFEQYRTPAQPADSIRRGYDYGADSIVMSAFHRFRLHGKPTIELIMFVQLYLGLYKSLGHDIPKVYEASKQVACAIGDALAEYEAVRSDRRFHSTSEFPVRDENLHDLQGMIARVTTTKTTASIMSGKGTPSYKITRQEDTHQHIACVKAPTCSGTLLSRILHINQVAALEICRETRFLDLMAHLYSACRRSDDLGVEWCDMAFAINHLGSSELGLTKLETEKGLDASSAENRRQSLLPIAKRFGIAMGISETQFAKRAQLVASVSNVSGQRVKLPTAAATTGIASYSGGPRLHASLNYISTLCGIPILEGTKRQRATEGLAYHILKRDHHIVDQEIKNAYDRDGIAGLSEVQLLSTLALISERDAMGLHFNYRKFLTHCTVMLKLVKDRTNNLVAAARVRRGLSQTFTYREMVDEILWAAAIGAAKANAHQTAHASGKLLRIAAEVIADSMPAYNSPCYDQARLFTISGISQSQAETAASIIPPQEPVELDPLQSHDTTYPKAHASFDSSPMIASPVPRALADWLDAYYEVDPSSDVKQNSLWKTYRQRYTGITNEEELEILLSSETNMTTAQTEHLMIALLPPQTYADSDDAELYTEELSPHLQLELLAFTRSISGKAQKVPAEPLNISAAELVIWVADYFSGARVISNTSGVIVKGIKAKESLEPRGSLRELKKSLNQHARALRAATALTTSMSRLMQPETGENTDLYRTDDQDVHRRVLSPSLAVEILGHLLENDKIKDDLASRGFSDSGLQDLHDLNKMAIPDKKRIMRAALQISAKKMAAGAIVPMPVEDGVQQQPGVTEPDIITNTAELPCAVSGVMNAPDSPSSQDGVHIETVMRNALVEGLEESQIKAELSCLKRNDRELEDLLAGIQALNAGPPQTRQARVEFTLAYLFNRLATIDASIPSALAAKDDEPIETKAIEPLAALHELKTPVNQEEAVSPSLDATKSQPLLEDEIRVRSPQDDVPPVVLRKEIAETLADRHASSSKVEDSDCAPATIDEQPMLDALPRLIESQAQVEHVDFVYELAAEASDEQPLLDVSPHCDRSHEQGRASFSRRRPEPPSAFDKRPRICSTSTPLPMRQEEEDVRSSTWTWTDYLEIAGRVLGPPVAAGALMAWLSQKVGR